MKKIVALLLLVLLIVPSVAFAVRVVSPNGGEEFYQLEKVKYEADNSGVFYCPPLGGLKLPASAGSF